MTNIVQVDRASYQVVIESPTSSAVEISVPGPRGDSGSAAQVSSVAGNLITVYPDGIHVSDTANVAFTTLPPLP